MSQRPTLHLMCGLPGAGKTTEARRIELESEAVRLTPDDWIHSFNQDHWSRKDIDGLRDPVEEAQRELAKRLLGLGVSVILDWGLWGHDERTGLRDMARKLGARVELHVLEAPREELLRRLAGRVPVPGIDRVTEAELDLWDTWFQRPTSEEREGFDQSV
jgi:predicted kinase